MQIMDDHYLFRHRHVSKRSVSEHNHYQDTLLTEPQVSQALFLCLFEYLTNIIQPILKNHFVYRYFCGSVRFSWIHSITDFINNICEWYKAFEWLCMILHDHAWLSNVSYLSTCNSVVFSVMFETCLLRVYCVKYFQDKLQ